MDKEKQLKKMVGSVAGASALVSGLLLLINTWLLNNGYPTISNGIIIHILFGITIGGTLGLVQSKKKGLRGFLGGILGGLSFGLLESISVPLGILAFGGFIGLGLASAEEKINKKIAQVLGVTSGTLLAAIIFGTLRNILPGETLFQQTMIHTLWGSIYGASTALGGSLILLAKDKSLLEEYYEDLHKKLDIPYIEYLENSYNEYNKIIHAMVSIPINLQPDKETLINGLEKLVLKIFKLCEHSQNVDKDSEDFNISIMQNRIQELTSKADTSEDEISKKQYLKACKSLTQQLKRFDNIKLNHRRIVSRLTNYLISLENIRLSIIELKSSSLQNVSIEMDNILETVKMLSEDIDITTETIQELDTSLEE